MSYEVICADVLDWAASYDGPKYHALLCDPPYELAFMGKDWDKSGIAFNPDTWAALAEHLHPGAFGMAFASARGWHRLACAIEDAGLRIHPSIFGWAQGSGFPKATRIDTQIDKAAGAEREVVRSQEFTRDFKDISGGRYGDKSVSSNATMVDITAPATPLAQAWAGHRYGLQAMKPALEPIIVFQKPYSGRPVDSIVETGAGALWVDGGRVVTGESTIRPLGETAYQKRKKGIVGSYEESSNTLVSQYGGSTQGRWPANLVLTHLPGCERVGVKRVKGHKGYPNGPGGAGSMAFSRDYQSMQGYVPDGEPFANEVEFSEMHREGYADPDGKETVADWRCEPDCPVRRLGEQSGERKSTGGDGSGFGRKGQSAMFQRSGKAIINEGTNGLGLGDTGTAARFYYQADWQYEIAERLADADPVRYVAKAARKERDAGLEGMEAENGLPSVGRRKCEKCKAWEWRSAQPDLRRCECKIPKWKKVINKKNNRNPHPTVKPIALTRWLATLLLPPDAYSPRRLLVPFCGSGSEMIGAGIVGWEEITGIEFDADTCAIAEARLEHWLENVQMELAL